jgi:hypothetical protein
MWPDDQQVAHRALVDQPPRAQLMMRTPFLVFIRLARLEGCSGLLGERRVHGDEVGARQQLSSVTFSTPSSLARVLGQENGIVGDHPHLQAMARSATIEPMLPQPIRPAS